MRKLLALLLLIAPPPAAAFDVRGVSLGVSEAEVKRQFPSAHCKALEWASKAADRRCDDSRVGFGGIELRVTFYLRKDALEAFDARFDTKELERFLGFLKSRYGATASESRDRIDKKGQKAREIYKALWRRQGESAALTAQLDKRAGSLLVWRGDFDEEIYRVR